MDELEDILAETRTTPVGFNMPSFGATYVQPKKDNKYRMFDSKKIDILRGVLLMDVLRNLLNQTTKDDDGAVKKYISRFGQMDGYTAMKLTHSDYLMALQELFDTYRGNNSRMELSNNGEWSPVCYIKSRKNMYTPISKGEKNVWGGRYTVSEVDHLYRIELMNDIMSSDEAHKRSGSIIHAEAKAHLLKNSKLFNGRYFQIDPDGNVESIDKQMFNTLVILLNRNLFIPHVLRVFENISKLIREANRFTDSVNSDVSNNEYGQRIFSLTQPVKEQIVKELGDKAPQDSDKLGSLLYNASQVYINENYDKFIDGMTKTALAEIERKNKQNAKVKYVGVNSLGEQVIQIADSTDNW